MKFKLAKPFIVGDIHNQHEIDELELASISFNFEPAYADKGHANMSVVLVHRKSDYKANVVYREDASALELWKLLNARHGLAEQIIDKLIADGKLPAGEKLTT
jgi:hypothetical protein